MFSNLHMLSLDEWLFRERLDVKIKWFIIAKNVRIRENVWQLYPESSTQFELD